jgi:hypothetical protein
MGFTMNNHMMAQNNDPDIEEILLSEEELTRDDLEKQRIDALENRDALNYARLCSKLGIDPELKDLYEQGILEYEQTPEGKERKKLLEAKLEKELREKEFLETAKTSGVRKYDVDLDIKQKKAILQEYFPESFGPKGNNNLSRNIYKKNPEKIGIAFKKLCRFYEKIHLSSEDIFIPEEYR